MIYIEVPSSSYQIQSDDCVIYQSILTGMLTYSILSDGLNHDRIKHLDSMIPTDRIDAGASGMKNLYLNGVRLLSDSVHSGRHLYLTVDGYPNKEGYRSSDMSRIFDWKSFYNKLDDSIQDGRIVITSLLPMITIPTPSKDMSVLSEYHLSKSSAKYLSYLINWNQTKTFYLCDIYVWERSDQCAFKNMEESDFKKIRYHLDIENVQFNSPKKCYSSVRTGMFLHEQYFGDFPHYFLHEFNDIVNVLGAYNSVWKRLSAHHGNEESMLLFKHCFIEIVDKVFKYATVCLLPYSLSKSEKSEIVQQMVKSFRWYVSANNIPEEFDMTDLNPFLREYLENKPVTSHGDYKPELLYRRPIFNHFDDDPIEDTDNRIFNTNINNKNTMKDSGMFGNMMEKFKSMIVPVTDPNLKITMDGNVAVRNSEGTYVTIDSENNLVEYPADFTISVPIYVIKKPFASIQTGEIVRKGNTYAKVIGKNADGSLKCLSFSGYTTTKKGVTDFMLGASYGDVVVNIMNIQNSGINPMMLMLMNDGGETNLKDMMMFMMMSGQGGQMNPMMLMMLMGDKAGGNSKMMETMMMMSMMGGMNQGMNMNFGGFGNMFGGGAKMQNPFASMFGNMAPGKKVAKPEEEDHNDAPAEE